MIRDENMQTYNPVQAVVVYRKNNLHYLETHDIHKSDEGFSWAAGKPFNREQLAELSLALGDQTFTPLEIKGLLPAGLLSFRQTFLNINLVWWLPPGKRMLYFTKALKLENRAYNMPGLVFCVTNKTLHVFAVKGSSKPTLKTKLYRGPFHNTSVDGNVCLGTAGEARKKKILHEELARWEKRFFNSRFTHGGNGNVAKGMNINLVLKAAARQRFNEAALVLSPVKTIDTLLKKFLTAKNDE